MGLTMARSPTNHVDFELNATRRRRNATQTKAAILHAAKRQFAQGPYEDVGLRSIASEAGVDAAIIIRHFGSKEQLFIAAIEEIVEFGAILAGDRATAGVRLTKRALQGASFGEKEPHPGEKSFPVMLLLHAGLSPTAGTLLRQRLDDWVIQPLAHWLGGEEAPLRAGLICSSLIGLGAIYRVIALDPVAHAQENTLVRRQGALIQSLIDG